MNLLNLHISQAQILQAIEQLPKEIKLGLIQKWSQDFQLKPVENTSSFDDLILTDEELNAPFDWEAARLTEKKLAPLKELWKDETATPEELIAMLGK